MVRRMEAQDQEFFLKVFGSLRPDSQMRLLGGSPFSSVLVYEHSSRTCRTSTSADLSWIAAIYLNVHKKFRPQSKRLPGLGGKSGILSQFSSFANRLRWKWFFKDSSQVRDSGVIRRTRTADFASSGIIAPPPLEAYLRRLKSCIFGTADALLKEQSGQRRWWCNASLADSLAISELSSANFFPIPADKAGLFVLVRQEDLVAVHSELLTFAWYKSVELLHQNSTTVVHLQPAVQTRWKNELFGMAKWRYEALANQIARFDDRQSIAALCESLSFGPKQGFIAKMINTVKSHKKVVEFRPVHSMSNYCFKGLSLWLCSVLEPIVKRYKWLCESSEASLVKLQSKSFPRDCQFVHIDIRNFFMQGSISFLLRSVCALIGNEKLRDLVYDVLKFLLEFQFVESSTGGGVRQVCEGSSMGLPHSGYVAVLAFVHSQDLNGSGIARRPFQRSHGILLYIRYIDNLLFVADGHCNVNALVSELAAIGPYKTTLEEAGASSVDFLDFQVVKSERFMSTGFVGFQPVLRDKGPFLTYFSSHSNSVHMNWPIAYIRRLWKRSSEIEYFKAAKGKFLSKLRQNCFPDFLVAYFDNCTNYYQPYEYVRTYRFRDDNRMFLVLPYHRLWHASRLSSEVRSCSDKHREFLQESFGNFNPFKLEVSWKLNELPLGNTLIRW